MNLVGCDLVAVLGSLPHRIRDAIGLGRRELGVGERTGDGEVDISASSTSSPAEAGSRVGDGPGRRAVQARGEDLRPRRVEIDQFAGHACAHGSGLVAAGASFRRDRSRFRTGRGARRKVAPVRCGKPRSTNSPGAAEPGLDVD